MTDRDTEIATQIAGVYKSKGFEAARRELFRLAAEERAARDRADLLDLFKQRRRNLVDQLEHDDEFETASRLGDVQSVIAAIEAVIAEPAPVKTGPVIEFDGAGWPKG